MLNLASLSKIVFVAAAPFAIVACCSGVENPDDQLQVEITDDLSEDPAAPQPTNACGAEVVAVDEEGNAIDLEERVVADSTGADRCVYVGTVDPYAVYRVEVKRDDKVATADGFVSNPACSVATDPADDDGALSLITPAPIATLDSYQAPIAKRAL